MSDTDKETGKDVSTNGGTDACQEIGKIRRGVTPTGVVVEGYLFKSGNDCFILKYDPCAGEMCFLITEVIE